MNFIKEMTIDEALKIHPEVKSETYFETHNLTERAEEMLYKLKSIELCSNTIG